MDPGRENRVLSWLEQMNIELEQQYNIFARNVISPDDIGEDNYHDIVSDLNNVMSLIDEVIFKIENVVEEGDDEEE